MTDKDNPLDGVEGLSPTDPRIQETLREIDERLREFDECVKERRWPEFVGTVLDIVYGPTLVSQPPPSDPRIT